MSLISEPLAVAVTESGGNLKYCRLGNFMLKMICFNLYFVAQRFRNVVCIRILIFLAFNFSRSAYIYIYTKIFYWQEFPDLVCHMVCTHYSKLLCNGMSLCILWLPHHFVL